MRSRPGFEYSARHSYDRGGVPERYESERFSGRLGRYRRMRERRAVEAMLGQLPRDMRILDCPCGNGRWWPVLAQSASSLVALDVSQAMLEYASNRSHEVGVPVEVAVGQAESLPLADESVDCVFSFALTKHLPVPLQYEVLREFARVARVGVICTFGVMSHATYEIWRRRRLPESYPILPEELSWMADAAGLDIIDRRKCTTPIGVEHVVLFRCAA